MKKLFLAAGIVVLGLSVVFAQERTSPQKAVPTTKRAELQQQRVKQFDPQKRAVLKVERLDKIVGLSKEQKAQAQAIYLKEAEAAQTRVRFRKANNEAIQQLLTEEQRVKLDRVEQQRMQQMKNRRPVNRGELKQAPRKKGHTLPVEPAKAK